MIKTNVASAMFATNIKHSGPSATRFLIFIVFHNLIIAWIVLSFMYVTSIQKLGPRIQFRLYVLWPGSAAGYRLKPLPFAMGREQALAFLCSLHRTATLHDFVVRSLVRIRASGMKNARPKGLTIFMAPHIGHELS